MAIIGRASSRPLRSSWKLSSLIGPVVYMLTGGLIGVTICLSWVESQSFLYPWTSFSSSTSTTATMQEQHQQELLAKPIVGVDRKENTSCSMAATMSVEQQDFFAIANKTGTDKVAGMRSIDACLKNSTACTRPGCVNAKCRPWGHFYHTMYQSRLGHLSTNTTDPFQMLEIGFYHGRGYEAYSQFFPRAELHSMEISCLPKGPASEGKWPHGNFAARSRKWYNPLRHSYRLHCGDASNVEWLWHIWTSYMNRKDSPPLKLVIDDGSHLAKHMAQTVFFWFPRIQPGGYLVVEDIQPTKESNKFRTQFLPQLISDLHYCGDPKEEAGGKVETPCFPQLQSLLHSVHCELHICIFERNQEPAIQNMSAMESKTPRTALSMTGCQALKDSFGMGL